MLRSRVGCGLVLGGVLVILSGCVPMEPVDRISVRTHNGVLEFAVCQKYKGDQIKVSSVSQADNGVRITWDTRGDFRSNGETVFTYGESQGGAQAVAGPDPVRLKNHYIDFAMNQLDENGRPLIGLFAHFDGNDVTSRWLSAGGGHMDQPCGTG